MPIRFREATEANVCPVNEERDLADQSGTLD